MVLGVSFQMPSVSASFHCAGLIEKKRVEFVSTAFANEKNFLMSPTLDPNRRPNLTSCQTLSDRVLFVFDRLDPFVHRSGLGRHPVIHRKIQISPTVE